MELNTILSLPKSTMLTPKEFDNVIWKIPVNPIATLEVIERLKEVPQGETPLDLVFAIKFKDSKNGRIYSIDAYRSIVKQILTSDVFIPVCYGHQDKDRVSWEGRKIVGSVIGAALNEIEGIVYYRIIPDASKNNEDIRRWLRNKQINSVSIWGYSTSEKSIDGKEVVNDFSLLSVDFVPPLTAGQDNIALVMGEMHNQFDNGIIDNPINDKEANMPDEKLKIEDVTNEALQKEVTCRMKDGRLSLKTLAGEMKCSVLTGEEVEADNLEKEVLKKEINTILEKAKALGFDSLDKLFDFASETLKKFEEEKLQGEFKTIKEQVLTEKGLFENGKPKGKLGELIDRYVPIKQGMTKAEIDAMVSKMIEDKTLKELVTKGNVGTGESINLKGEMLGGNNPNLEDVFEI